jgi:hypothetical protein
LNFLAEAAPYLHSQESNILAFRGSAEFTVKACQRQAAPVRKLQLCRIVQYPGAVAADQFQYVTDSRTSLVAVNPC